MSKKFTLPSGAELQVTMGSFVESKNLYQAILKEAKDLKISDEMEIDSNFLKDIVCSLLSSKEIEECIETLLKRCTYDKSKITEDTFEDENARQDYYDVIRYVTEVNVYPFVKGLLQKYGAILGKLKQSFQKQE